MPLAPELVQILACPRCKGRLLELPDDRGLVCDRCGLLYPVRDQIPVMLVEEALPWPPGQGPEGGRS
jgi:uncharacterized protein YbaR (Trm112 family)